MTDVVPRNGAYQQIGAAGPVSAKSSQLAAEPNPGALAASTTHAVSGRDAQVTFRLTAEQDEEMRCCAQADGRPLAAEWRAAASLFTRFRALWLLRHDHETRVRVGGQVDERQRQASVQLVLLARSLFERGPCPAELLAAPAGRNMSSRPTKDERPAARPGALMTAVQGDRRERQ